MKGDFSCINPSGRDELVGKRFLLVENSNSKLKLSRITEWNWKAGIIRCSSHLDNKDPELQILVEFDDQSWSSREWLNVYKDKEYNFLVVENTLVLATRTGQSGHGNLHPALTFKPLVDTPGLYKGPKGSKLPVEFLSDLKLDFQDCTKLKVITHWEPSITGLNTNSLNEKCVNEWSDIQRGQHLMKNFGLHLFGMRISVYRAEGTTQWFTAVTTGYNTSSQEYTLTDDTVLEEHFEDPRLTQMQLLGGRMVLESILRGDNVTPRRSRSSVAGQQSQSVQPIPAVPSRSKSQSPASSTGSSSKKSAKKQASTDAESVSSENSTTSQPQIQVSRPRGRPAKKSKQPPDQEQQPLKNWAKQKPKKDEHNNDEKQESDKKTGQDKTAHGIRGKKATTRKNTIEASEAESEAEEPRKKVSKRTASVAALAAISDTNKAEEEDLFKPQILEAKNSPSQSKKAVAIVRPQPQVIGAKNNNENIDREARFSLYDFTSDSESEEPASSAHTKKEAVKKEAKTGPKFNRNKIFASTSPKLKKEPQQNSSVEPNKSTENSVTRTPSENPEAASTTLKADSPEAASSSSVPQNANSKMQDALHQPSSLRPNTADSSADRSGVPADRQDDKSIKASMGDKQPRQPSQPAPPPGAVPPTSAAAAHYAALSQQYHAAAAAMALSNPMAAQAQLLAQYQQSLAASTLTPDMILKQYPHLAAAGLSAPPHLLGRSPTTAEHLHLMHQRETQIAAERERQQRERREAEQRERERQEKERRERAERERAERERAERERKNLSAVEAVDHHFQMSMELAKKIPGFNRFMFSQRMQANTSHPWVPMTGAKPTSSATSSAPQVITIDDERQRRYDSEMRRAQERYLNPLHRSGAPPSAPAGAPGHHTPPPAHGMRKPSHLSPSGLPKPKDPGPPPPLTPLQTGRTLGGAAGANVSFKPYDFARRDPSPRSNYNYPTAYSAPPPTRPKVTSPMQVPKSTSRPDSSPATGASGPPPAHSGHMTRPPTYLPPPPPALSLANNSRQPLSAPTIGAPGANASAVHAGNNEQPLDLGSKRKVEVTDQIEPVPAKTVKLEADNGGQLLSVSEPSVLASSEASNITTIENTAIKNEDKPTYVHKLKKAWIKAYNDKDDLEQPPIKKSSDYSSPSTPSNTRATPSPASSAASKVNGHVKEESESSDNASKDGGQNLGKKSQRGQNGGRGGGRIGRKKASDMSDSDDKDSESSSSRKSQKGGRRGRKPKRGGGRNSAPKMETTEETNGTNNGSKKKEKENPFNNPPVSVLKKTGETFLQDSDCYKVAPKLAKCRECKWSQHNKNAGSSASIFCRFYGFRRLRYHVKNGQLAVAGFCDPFGREDVTEEDAELWEATAENAPDGLSEEQAKYCLELLKTDFDLIVKEERQASQENIGEENVVSWKRVVQGVSESCDVCDATLFNLHWACPRCGFVVCLQCYISRKDQKCQNGESESGNSTSSQATKDDKDKYSWLLCTNKNQHDLDKLMLTQIVTGDALEELDKKLNNCGVKFRLANAGSKKLNGHLNQEQGASLRDLISGSEQKVKMSDIIDACVEDSMEEKSGRKLTHFVRNSDKDYKWRHGFAPKRRSYSLVETKVQYPNVTHSWLANGNVLRLDSDKEASNVDLFQDIWSRGQPVVVANATKNLNVSKWYPQALNEDFGDEKVELIDLKNNQSLGEHSMKKFWDGYSHVNKRVKDRDGQPAAAKLLNWPSNFGDEFKELLPERSAEFLRTLPMSCYTGRAAPLNLAASLPDTFARAEVGPRASITYGCLEAGSRFSVERADSVIVCVHAQVPKLDDFETDAFKVKAVKVMEAAGCDMASVNKAKDEKLPAAIWTIFHPADADSIRDCLNKNNSEADFDPFLTDDLALEAEIVKKLKDEYDVKPFVVAQWPGEALFIPAGSPRQVKHLLSSISLESDFVSPENVSQSFFMYRQLRHVCESQKQPIVDKLSIKNLIFHSVKNAVATLERSRENANGCNESAD